MKQIPISVIVVIKNVGAELETCLSSLLQFDDILVVDSSEDREAKELCEKYNALYHTYQWKGTYPKKRGWCLENLSRKHNWVFFVDADEVVTPELNKELAALFQTPPKEAGYFITGQYVWNGKLLSFGLKNRKIALFHRDRMHFPVIDDLDCPGMGEIEGHYQPVLKSDGIIGKLNSPLLHYANHTKEKWLERHRRYAVWEICMNKKDAWPDDPVPWRNALKALLRQNPLRPELAFIHSYVLKMGWFDGAAGLDFAKSRWHYYRMIRSKNKNKNKNEN